MKKKSLLLLIVVLLLPILCTPIIYATQMQSMPAIADSGFDGGYDDGDYGGGSWGGDSWGGGSWGGDDDYYGGGGYSLGNLTTGEIFLLLGTLFVIFFFVMYFNALSNKRKARQAIQRAIENTLSSNYQLSPGDGLNDDTIQSVYQNYVAIQEAWMKRNLSPIKHLLTDEMYNMYQMQVDTLIEDKQINVMKDFKFVCGKVLNSTIDANSETLQIVLCVDCKDYIQEENSNKIISGDKNATITYIYELTFVKDLDTKETINCPSCGGQVERQMSAVCPYCKNVLQLTSSNLTMSNKIIKHQYKRK